MILRLELFWVWLVPIYNIPVVLPCGRQVGGGREEMRNIPEQSTVRPLGLAEVFTLISPQKCSQSLIAEG